MESVVCSLSDRPPVILLRRFNGGTGQYKALQVARYLNTYIWKHSRTFKKLL